MLAMTPGEAFSINVVNVVLALACLAIAVTVGVAVWLDVRERRRWRAMVPPCWPPPGVDPADAYVESEAKEAPAQPRSQGQPLP